MFGSTTFRNLFAATFMTGMASVAAADPILPYSQDFTGDNGTQPTGWSVLNGTASIQNSVYEGAHDTNPVAAYQGGDASSWSDYTVTSDFFQGRWSSSTGQLTGVAARIQDRGNFYSAELRNQTFRIWRQATADNGGNAVVASAGGITYPQGLDNPETAWWRISLTVNGTALSASIYDSDGELVQSINGTDTTFASGAPGVRASVGNQQGSISRWDNFQVVDVPEPAAATVMLVALAALRRSRPQ